LTLTPAVTAWLACSGGIGLVQLGARGFIGGAGAVEFFLADRAAANQAAAALIGFARAVEIGLRGGAAGGGLAGIGPARRNHCRSRAGAGFGLAEALAGAGQLRFGAGQFDPGIGIVQHHQHIALLDQLGAARLHFAYRA
jgi:hypothetical protein